MSLILEALRKSEAERQIGRAPGLMTPMPTVPRSRRVPLLLLAVSLLFAGVAGGWWVAHHGGERTDRPTAVAIVDGSDPQPRDGTIETPASAPPATTAPPAQPAIRVTPGRSVAHTPPSDPVTEPPPALPSDPAFDSREREALPQPAAATPPAELLPPPAVQAAAVPTAPAEPPAVGDNGDSLPGLHALDAERRAALPPLRMSMHVYTDAIASRFVLIDGRRYAEGQSIEPGLEVAQIRRDGVVLAVDGQRVLLTSR